MQDPDCLFWYCVSSLPEKLETPVNEQEGVIKYKLSHQQQPIEQAIAISEINTWRTLLFKLELIGQIQGRYDGYGFGNISQRITQANTPKDSFIISGTQTGSLESLSKKHYSVILEACSKNNSIKSAGETKPSSEALTHANVYHQDNSIQAIIHIHSPEIWNNTQQLSLPYTASGIAYGTVEMANAVEQLFRTAKFHNTGVFSMLGHKDGIVAFADTMDKVGSLIIQLYTKAMILEISKRQS